MFEIGASLREARTRQGLDFPEMEARTKVRAKYLRLLEEEQFEQLPAHTYVKGFLRTYADCLGLDGQLYVDEYNSRFVAGEDETQVRARRTPATTSRSRSRRRERRESRVVVARARGDRDRHCARHRRVAVRRPERPERPRADQRGDGKPAAQRQPTVVSVRAAHGRLVRRRRATAARRGGRSSAARWSAVTCRRFPQRLLWLSITSPKNVVVTVYGKRITIPAGGDFQLTVPRR